MKRNIALAGNMYAGKSTIADVLTEYGYHRMAFAAPLKNVAALAYGTIEKGNDYETVGLDGAASPKSGRTILQEVGQAMKAVDRDFWIKCFLRDAERYGDQPLVVDDMRFLFEMDALLDRNWVVVGVSTDLVTRMERAQVITGRLPTYDELAHASEVEIPDVIASSDVVVDGTEDPYKSVAEIMKVADGAHKGS